MTSMGKNIFNLYSGITTLYFPSKSFACETPDVEVAFGLVVPKTLWRRKTGHLSSWEVKIFVFVSFWSVYIFYKLHHKFSLKIILSNFPIDTLQKVYNMIMYFNFESFLTVHTVRKKFDLLLLSLLCRCLCFQKQSRIFFVSKEEFPLTVTFKSA